MAEPGWVVFDVEGDIVLSRRLRPASQLTIDGRGRRVRLLGHGVELVGVENVILTHLTFAEGAGGETNDACAVRRSRTVWIDHCTFSGFGDGLLDITRGGTDVTVSWCRFRDHRKTMLIGANPDHTGDREIRVTLHHNWFHGTHSRHPRLRWGSVHAFNNLFEAWGGYAMGSSHHGRLLSEANVFAPAKDRDAILCQVGDDPEPGAVVSRGDLLLGEARAAVRGEVAEPPYPYQAEPASRELAARIRAAAGD